MAKPTRADQVWDRQPGESHRAFEAFRAFLTMGPSRQVLKAASAVGKARQQLTVWADRWSWNERATAYDTHLAAVEDEARQKARAAEIAKWERRRLEHLDRAYLSGQKLYQAAETLLKHAIVTSGDETVVMGRWTLATIGDFYRKACELSGVAIDAATIDVELEAFDPATASPEQAQALLDRLAARKKQVHDAMAKGV